MGSVTLVPSAYTSGCSVYDEQWTSIDKQTASYLAAPRILFKFTVPTSLSNVTIKSVKINYQLYNPGGSVIYVRNTTIKPASWNDAYIGYINSNNYNGFVTTGVGVTIPGEYTPSTNQPQEADITSIFANNITDNAFKVEIYPSYVGCWDNSTPMENRLLYVYTNPTITVTYEDVVPGTPIISEPNEQYVNDTDNVTFRWVYSADSAYPQASVTIEYKLSTASAYTVVTVTQSTNYYTFLAGTFSAGTIEYRIKTTDTYGNVSEYAYARFVVKTRPTKPTITSVTNASLTTIQWNSSEQTAYEMRLYKGEELLYSESISSINKVFKPKLFLPDGTYTFEVNVKNAFDLWSGISAKVFTISTTKPSKPTISAYADNDKVILHITSSVSDNYIYRVTDGVETCIGRIQSTAGGLIDSAGIVNVASQYYVRAYATGYTDSDQVIARPFAQGFVLSDSTYSLYATKSLEKFMPFNESQNRSKQLNHYLGRKDPVKEQSEFTDYSITRTCFVTEEQLSILLKLENSDETLLYRDDRGRKIYCDLTINKIKNELINSGYEVEIVLTKIDYTEGVVVNA